MRSVGSPGGISSVRGGSAGTGDLPSRYECNPFVSTGPGCEDIPSGHLDTIGRAGEALAGTAPRWGQTSRFLAIGAPPEFRRFVEAGEMSGSLPAVLRHYAGRMESRQRHWRLLAALSRAFPLVNMANRSQRPGQPFSVPGHLGPIFILMDIGHDA